MSFPSGVSAREAAVQAGWRANRLSLAVAVVLGGAWAAMPRFLAGLFTHDAALIEELVPFMIVLALVQPALQSHFALGGAHRGAGDTFTRALRGLRTGCEKHHVIGITDQSRGSGGTWCR